MMAQGLRQLTYWKKYSNQIISSSSSSFVTELEALIYFSGYRKCRKTLTMPLSIILSLRRGT